MAQISWKCCPFAIVFISIGFLTCGAADDQRMREVFMSLLDIMEHHSLYYQSWANSSEQCAPVQVRRGRSVTDGSPRFDLWYHSKVPATDVKVTWLDPTRVVFPGTVDDSPLHVTDQIWKSSYTLASPQEGAMLTLVLGCPEISYTLQLNTSGNDVTQRDLTPFEYHSNPTRVIEYNPHMAFHFEVTTQGVENFQLISRLYNPTTRQMMPAQQIAWNTRPIAKYFRNRGTSPSVRRFLFNPGNISYSGLIEIHFRSSQSLGSLMPYMEINKQMAVIPNSQTAPFPTGHVIFDHTGLHQARDGSWYKDCRNTDRECPVRCDAFGNGLSRLRMYKSRSNLFHGNQVPVRNPIASTNAYFRSIATEGQATALEEEEAIFTCLAQTEAGPAHNMTINVRYQVGVEIRRPLKVETNLLYSRVKVTCTALGRPAPTFQFALRYDNDYRLVQPTYRGLARGSTYQATAYVVTSKFADPEARTDRLREVTCSADGVDSGHDHRSVTIRG